MKKLHSFAFYALVTPAIALSSGAVLAGQSTDLDIEPQSTQRDQDQRDKDAKKSAQGEQSSQHARQADSDPAADRRSANVSDKPRMENRGYLGSAPANGMKASNLIGAEVKNTGNENVGSVSDLVLDRKGQVVAIVVGVGGFLGMGERDVAIGWDDVTRSGTPDEMELRIDVTREGLRAAPEYKKPD